MKLFSTRNKSARLDQEFVSRYWDLVGRVGHLEDRLEERLHELELRYKRSEQSLRRLDEKRQEKPCDEEKSPNGSMSPAFQEARSRRRAVASE